MTTAPEMKLLLSVFLTCILISWSTAKDPASSQRAKLQWTKSEVSGLTLELIDPKAVEVISFEEDGSAFLTVGLKDGAVAFPVFYWEVVSGRLRITRVTGKENQRYDEFTLLARGATSITVRRRNGKTATYKRIDKSAPCSNENAPADCSEPGTLDFMEALNAAPNSR